MVTRHQIARTPVCSSDSHSAMCDAVLRSLDSFGTGETQIAT